MLTVDDVRRNEGGVEYRHIAADDCEMRADEGDDKVLRGYAARFESRSEDLGFREVIDPEAFTRTLKARNDVKALVNHDSTLVIGSTRAGTLDLSIDDRGLADVIHLPETTYANDLHTVVKRKDVDGQSFGFSVVRDEWNADYSQRRLLEVRLHEVSVVTFPAYRATTVSARALQRLAHRTALDADALADALDALSLGSEISDDQAAVLLEAVDRSRPAREPEPEQVPDLSEVLALKSYLLKKLAD
jgi:HK97 family phage prohead protease